MTVLEEHRKKELEKKARSRRQMKSLSYVNICHGIVTYRFRQKSDACLGQLLVTSPCILGRQGVQIKLARNPMQKFD